jgi:hypothetical protein
MKIKELRKDYEEYSVQAGNLNRNLVYAGIAIIWIFRSTDNSGATTIPLALHTPLLMLITSLIIEIAQKLYQTVVTYLQYFYFKFKYKNEHDVEEKIIRESEILPIFAWLLWMLKFVSTLFAYILIGEYISLSIKEFHGIIAWILNFFKVWQ